MTPAEERIQAKKAKEARLKKRGAHTAKLLVKLE